MEALRAQSSQVGIGLGLARQPSSDSVSSLSSACSLEKHEKKKKKGWVNIVIYLISSIIFNTLNYFLIAYLLKSTRGLKVLRNINNQILL